MESNRSDNRRRRVLYDESVQQPTVLGDASGPVSGKRRRSSNYAAKVIQHLKVSDLVPVRKLALWLIATGSVVSVVVLQFLDSLARRTPSPLNTDWFPALSLSSTTGIASWLTSVVFLLAGIACCLIYSMRRHRRDDYRGTYRVWFLYAGACFLGSLLTSVPLFAIVSSLLMGAVSTPLLAPGQWGNTAIKLVMILVVFGRALIEVRGSRAALFLFAATAAVYSVMAVVQNQTVRGLVWLGDVLWLKQILPLLAALLVLNATLGFARFVWMDASGLVQPRVRRKRKKRSRKARSRTAKKTSVVEEARTKSTPLATPVSRQKSADSTSRPAASGRPSVEPSRPVERTGPLRAKMEQMSEMKSAKPESWDDDEDLPDEIDDENPRLSKAERRRLRKLQRRQRNAA